MARWAEDLTLEREPGTNLGRVLAIVEQWFELDTH